MQRRKTKHLGVFHGNGTLYRGGELVARVAYSFSLYQDFAGAQGFGTSVEWLPGLKDLRDCRASIVELSRKIAHEDVLILRFDEPVEALDNAESIKIQVIARFGVGDQFQWVVTS